MKNVIINEKDNVGVCLDGSKTIPAGHKYALRYIAKGEYVVKYGDAEYSSGRVGAYA